MIVFENQCIDCGLPCIGDRCIYKNVEMHYCDRCGREAAYRIYEEELCFNCANQILNDSFGDLTVTEKAETLSIYCKPFQ